ncbi:hypothetical protein HPB48_002947 [Haemaphysalis longicornis]|uniref:Uncharacterized protein n=1 Tax=Haemaphysalis longicornis TaxID=44386 RepID=A0A9J6FDU9_HAELO|nr:hypothetical protein HPB48_002947 [Haemaphysalis longicornis]
MSETGAETKGGQRGFVPAVSLFGLRCDRAADRASTPRGADCEPAACYTWTPAAGIFRMRNFRRSSPDRVVRKQRSPRKVRATTAAADQCLVSDACRTTTSNK